MQWSARSPKVIGSLCLVALIGCGDSGGPSAVGVTGDWTGTMTLPNAYSTTATLQETGTAVSGTMRVAGSFTDQPLTGQVDGQTRAMSWTVLRGCETWSGVLTLAPGGDQMSGPVLIDRTGCQPVQPNGSGSLSLSRSQGA